MIKVLNFFGHILIIMAVIMVFRIRLYYPELTETQLFIQHWDSWLACIIMAISGFIAINAKDN